jgi:predicted nucleic acid-binding protein
MPNVISNSSALIALDNIEMIFILRELYGKIYITNEVYHEFGKNIENWIESKTVNNRNYIYLLNNLIDLEESSTIALALEMSDNLIILARRVDKAPAAIHLPERKPPH